MTVGLQGAFRVIVPALVAVCGTQAADTTNYDVTHDWEIGYRVHAVGGNRGKYRSDLNLSNGVRLLYGQLGIHSRDGRGRLLDELALTAHGLGDPYESADLRVRKNRIYEYNLLWRRNAYVYPALALESGQQSLDTTRRWQDHDLTLFPDRGFRGILGYGRNTQDGPGLSSVNFFGAAGDEFPLLTDIRRATSEYRLGGEARFRQFGFRVVRVWEPFTENTVNRDPTSVAGADTADAVTLAAFHRDEPYRGDSPSWRASLFAEQAGWLSLHANATYTGSRRDFLVRETASVTNIIGGALDQQLLVSGRGRRPVATGNVTVHLYPAERLDIASQTAYYSVRMEGDSRLSAFNNATLDFEQTAFQALGIRTIATTTDLRYRLLSWLGIQGGYGFSTRRVRSQESSAFDESGQTVTAEQESRLHTGRAGLRIQPIGGLTIQAEGEAGRADHPFYPISNKNYLSAGGRLRYSLGPLRLSASARLRDNTNSNSLAEHNSRSRDHSFDVLWTPSSRLTVDAVYNKTHLDTLSGIAYFVSSSLVEGERSIFISNVHTLNIGIRLALTRRLELYAAYNRVQDAGDGRAAAAQPPAGSEPGSASDPFRAVQTFPLVFQSPSAWVSFEVFDTLRWNASYGYYGYREEFLGSRDYRAHTGYVSLEWSF